MVKKILYAGTAIAVTIGAAYSYHQVRFGDRTLVFFRSVFGEENAFREGWRGGGIERRERVQPDSARRRFVERGVRDRLVRQEQEGARGRTEPPVRDREGTDRQVPDDVGQRGERLPDEVRERVERLSQGRGEGNSQSFGEARGREGRRGRRSDVSLKMVGYYTLILAFAVMVTYGVDGLTRRVVRARRTRRYSQRQQGLPAQ
ncbi:MAG: hypothetical protein JSW71_11760 [Gemmatimonadota bacterium]|nr:MAG: hypothetical protein JSW71_11760 [Gemmatimonadota bacterium]